MIFGQTAPHLHFVMVSTSYVAGPVLQFVSNKTLALKSLVMMKMRLL